MTTSAETFDLFGVPTEELKAEFEQRLRAQLSVPAGFRLSLTDWDIQGFQEDPSYCGDWQGPVFEGGQWKVQTFWTPEAGVTFYVDGNRDNAIPASESAKLADVLSKVAALA